MKAGLLTIMLLVDNEFGVLTRITAIIRREGGNIKSLIAAETATPTLSRLVIRIESLQGYADTIIHRIRRMDCVHKLDVYTPESFLMRELAVVSLAKEDTEATRIMLEYGARRMEGEDGIAYELVAMPETVDGFIARLQGSAIAVTRTGAIALERQEAIQKESASHE